MSRGSKSNEKSFISMYWETLYKYYLVAIVRLGQNTG